MIRPYPRFILTLTSLRFFAAFWVVALHYSTELPADGSNPVPLLANGMLGVDFFFILSGFILNHAHYQQILDRRIVIRAFLVKRLAKIYPMHLATLLFYLVLVTAVGLVHLRLPNPERYQGGQFVLNLFLVQAWQAHDAGTWNYPSWSVSAEWFAYLLFPFLASFLVQRTRAAPIELLVVAAVAFLLVVWAVSPWLLGNDLFSLHSNFGYVRILPEFILGIVLYRLGAERRLRWLENRFSLPLAVAVVLVLAASGAPQIVVVLAITVLILAAAERARQGSPALLAATPLVYLGDVSYSLYMVHQPVATILLQGAHLAFGRVPFWLVLLALPIALLVAIVAYHMIEEPSQRALLRYAGPRSADLPTTDRS